jgi:hypothetical protein
VERLQVELLGGLCRHELHGRALHRLGDRLGVSEVILLSLGIRAHVLRRHQARKVYRRVTPALAAGITDKLWSVEDIVAVVEASEPKPGKRGPYKKRVAAA